MSEEANLRTGGSAGPGNPEGAGRPPGRGLPDRLGWVRGAVVERREADFEEPRGELEPGVTVSPPRLTVPPRPSIPERVRFSWRSSDYGNRLDGEIQAPQLRRCVTI